MPTLGATQHALSGAGPFTVGGGQCPNWCIGAMQGQAALVIAAVKGHAAILELLLQKGAQVDLKSSDVRPLFLALLIQTSLHG